MAEAQPWVGALPWVEWEVCPGWELSSALGGNSAQLWVGWGSAQS